MTALDLDTPRREALTELMLDDLGARVPSVEISEDGRGWLCVLVGVGWRTPYRGSTRYDAVLAAHNNFYWPCT